MKKILLILAAVGIVATLVSANCTKRRGNKTLPVLGGKEHDCDEKKEIDAYILALREFNSAFFKHLYAQDPSKSYSLSGHQTFSPTGVLCMYTNSRDCCKILQLLKIKNVSNIIKIIRIVLNRLTAREHLVDIKFGAIANTSNEFRTYFKKVFKEIWGKTTNIDFSNRYEVETYAKQWCSSPRKQDFDLQKYNFIKNGMMITSLLDFKVDLNHVNNPKGVTVGNFRVDERINLKLPALEGNAFVECGKDWKLDTQFVKILVNRGKCYVVFAIPKDPKNMPRVVEKYSNITEYDKVVKYLKPMCVKLKWSIGSANMKYNMTPYLRGQGLISNVYDVFVKGKAKLSDMRTQTIFTAKKLTKRASIHSSKCRKNSKFMPEMSIDRPYLYWAVCDNIPVVSGSFMGYSHGGGQ